MWLRSIDGDKELFEGLHEPLRPTPAADDSHVDIVPPGDPEGGAQALSIPPVKKRREAVAARVGRREREERMRPDAELDGRDANVAADGERPAGELHEKARLRMHESIAVPSKANLPERFVQTGLRDRAREDQVDVVRLVEAAAVEARACAAADDGPDSFRTKGARHDRGDLSKGGSSGDSQGGLPVRRGLRRTDSTRRRSSSSGSESRVR